jgi:hypothetical protein
MMDIVRYIQKAVNGDGRCEVDQDCYEHLR